VLHEASNGITTGATSWKSHRISPTVSPLPNTNPGFGEHSGKSLLICKPETLLLIQEDAIKKGDVITVAEIAGVMAAKRTAELIPLCHPLDLSYLAVDLKVDAELPGLLVTATVKSTGKTGVEMEALTAVSVAALTIYDMVKSVEKTMRIQNIRLVEKHGGQSGDVLNE
jgi:cyclic pyranopterin phosphate synthase